MTMLEPTSMPSPDDSPKEPPPARESAPESASRPARAPRPSDVAGSEPDDHRDDHHVGQGAEGELEPRAAGLPMAAGRRATDGRERRGRGRPSDRMLNLLLLAAERDVRIGLTVSVGGVVVSGTLIGTLAYCRALADQFASAAGGTDMDESLADSFRDLVDDAAGVAGGDRRQPPDAAAYEQSVAFLHLADARYVGATGLLPIGRHGVLWRCPVVDVTGWSLGDLAPR